MSEFGELSVIPSPAAQLAECPVWSDGEQALYWTDILTGTIYRWGWGAAGVEAMRVSSIVGSFGLCTSGEMIVATEHEIGFFDPNARKFGMFFRLHPAFPGERFNDGRVDPLGGFVVGTMVPRGGPPVGRLLRVDPELRVTELLDSIEVSNGLAWSTDGRQMYFADSRKKVVRRFDYMGQTGALGAWKVFISTADSKGLPDGATVDVDGNYWLAQAGAHEVRKYSPSGTLTDRIEFPVCYPTAVCIGGPQMDTMFVTSASFLLTEAERLEFPMSGRVFALKTAARGISEPRFRR